MPKFWGVLPNPMVLIRFNLFIMSQKTDFPVAFDRIFVTSLTAKPINKFTKTIDTKNWKPINKYEAKIFKSKLLLIASNSTDDFAIVFMNDDRIWTNA